MSKHECIKKSILQILFAYVDSLTIGGIPPITGRPPICRKALLKCFFVKTVFQISSLRKLTRFLHQYPSFRVSCGLSFVPHISTFSRVGTWFCNEGIPFIHKQTLQEMNLGLIPCVLIDSTALRSSLYDSQAKWGKSTRYGWYKGYKAHVCSTPEGVVLSYAFTTANVHDSKMAPVGSGAKIPKCLKCVFQIWPYWYYYLKRCVISMEKENIFKWKHY
ncbi:transposase, partial [Bacillus thuringiensis]|uniref:transposase n=1 Tax=Bacillus thuringiensis TaxID=1428 RepID=UPI002A82EA95